MNLWQEKEFVIFDVETTGLSPRKGDRIVEVAALKIKDFEIVDRFETLIDPGRPLSFGAFLVNRITSEMLLGKPLAKDILLDLLDFLGEAILVGHHIQFDLSFLNYECLLAGKSPIHGRYFLDTARMGRMFLPGLRSYSLGSLARALEVECLRQHRAMIDVELTLGVFRKLIEIASGSNFRNFDHLLQC